LFMSFPATRLRRLRRTGALRSLVRETRLTPESFVYPLFVCPGEGVRKEVRSMPGVFNLSVDEAVKEADDAHSLGIPAVILFGLPEKKDEVATGAWEDDGIVQRAARAMKREIPELLLIGDVCLCEYMSHGHCGVVKPSAPRPVGAAVASPPVTGTDRDSQSAGRRRTREHSNSVLCGEVRIRILRSFPRGGRFRAAIRRSPLVSDGRRQPARGHA
jgi:porphobilinogen synthase